ncbi:MAG: Na+/H+ antiporter NhaA [Candidatus Cloacimonetes bacterium]|nr:Na+/H+ antiporter NhaA [Candidatus Cloacimonadota bacterium]
MTTRPTLDRVSQALQDFLRLEASGGLLLMLATVLAMSVANSPLAAHYLSLLDMPVQMRIGALDLHKPLILWINDGLMAVFFLLVGMELKREIVEGHLSSLRQASLPAFAAIGGMVAPALFYLVFNRGDAIATRGWAVPTATDIAFALGVLTLLGPRVPAALKAFLLSIAIFDDLGAIIVIALFYTAELSMGSLAIAGAMIGGLALLNRAGVTRPVFYILLGIPLWVAVLKSGVHATLAGVVLAMFIPLGTTGNKHGSNAGHSPLKDLEHALHPWVAFGVLPIFAFANAGVPLGGFTLADTLHPVPLGIVSGLFLGKQVGVMLACWIAVKLGLAARPDGIGWGPLYGAALLCGIGFTMSLFIASLAFEQGGMDWQGLERLGILVGSLISGVAGYFVLRTSLKESAPA